MYPERLLDHFRNPRNVGELPPPAIAVEVSNPACGDVMRLYVRFKGNTVADARYQTRGCTASIAAGSVLTEWLPGRTPAEMSALTVNEISAAAGGLPPESRHAAVLCVDALRSLLRAAQSTPA